MIGMACGNCWYKSFKGVSRETLGDGG